MTTAAFVGASQRKLRMKTVRIAGTPLEPHYHSVTGNRGRDGWKSVGIGQSAARSNRTTDGNQFFSRGFAENKAFGFVGSSSARRDVRFVVKEDFCLFFLAPKEGQDLLNELNGESISPDDAVCGPTGPQMLPLDMPVGEISNPRDRIEIAHRDLDTGSELEANRASDGGELLNQEATFSVHYASDISCFDIRHGGSLVQRLSRKGVGASAPKHMAYFPSFYNERKHGDIVSSSVKAEAATGCPAVAVSVSRTGAKIRPYMGDEYFGIAWPTTWRPVKNDLESVYQYRDEGFQMIYNGEIGKFEGVRFIEQTNISKGNYKGTGSYTTSSNFTAWANGLSDNAFFFGEDTVAEALVVPEEMRGMIPADYGRAKGIAWYYLGGFALTQTQALQSRIVRWGSAG